MNDFGLFHCIVVLVLLLGTFHQNYSKLYFPVIGLTFWAILSSAGVGEFASVVLAVTLVVAGLVFQFNPAIRRSVVTDSLFESAKAVLPRMSETERTALEAGTVWFDGDIFSGKPDWEKLRKFPKFKLSEEEQAFIDGPVNKLCEMLDDWQIHQDRDLPQEVWSFLKKEKFFGLVIPKQHGGLGFSASGHSAIVTRISTRSIPAAVTVMVPNSLGPGELLVHYGTDEQKDKYLPALADGREIPCFALTGPEAGSDAGAMQSFGTVMKKKIGGKSVLGVSLDFNKRYITLAPVATLIGLAFKLRDPDHLLGSTEDRGITCALLPRDTKGLIIGSRHDPMGMPFANGPIQGKDVFIPISSIIGREDGIGKGWRMLVESLAAGRSISLPSMSVGAAQLSTRVCGAYATIREQFDTPIGRFEGVEELLARIAGYTYMMDATRMLTCAAIDSGEKPSVLSGTVKAYLTEGMRQTLNDAMDLRAGAAIIRGPQNILSRAYTAIPIGITVEGSNVLTRSMIIYGQGAIRSHPYLLKELTALQSEDKTGFDALLWKHVSLVLSNFTRSFTLGMGLKTGISALLAGSAVNKAQFKLNYLCALFAFVSDVALLTYGGSLKRKETVSGRFADAFSWIYLAASSIKRYEDANRKEFTPFLEWCVQTACFKAYNALLGNIENLRNPVARISIRLLATPLWLSFKTPNDKLMSVVASSILDKDKRREDLSLDVFIPGKNDPALGRLEDALSMAAKTVPLKQKLEEARKKGKLNVPYGPTMIQEAINRSIITKEEAQKIKKYDELLWEVIDVDDFDIKEYKTLR